jgi:AmmeMemoRadiSam system protein B
MMLPEGWYPHNPQQAELQIDNWKRNIQPLNKKIVSGIGPHAGWFFSGKQAFQLVSSIPKETQLLIIAGGHLNRGLKNRILKFANFETPFGSLKLDEEASNALCSDFTPDYDSDNTVEIYLPLIKYIFPHMKILPVRLTPETSAVQWGAACQNYCKNHNISAFFLGSTDLSHYGQRFGYTEFGADLQSRKIVKSYDQQFLDSLCVMNTDLSLEIVERHHTACSAGAALGACGFALSAGIAGGEIIEQRYSYDLIPDDSNEFVGYGTVAYS